MRALCREQLPGGLGAEEWEMRMRDWLTNAPADAVLPLRNFLLTWMCWHSELLGAQEHIGSVEAFSAACAYDMPLQLQTSGGHARRLYQSAQVHWLGLGVRALQLPGMHCSAFDAHA